MAEHSEEAKDSVSINMRKMLSFLQKSPDQPCISKIPKYLRQVYKEAYDPQVISIGPYHRGKPQLQAMEQQKIRFLQLLLEEREEIDVSVYVNEMRKLEAEARKCYAADPDRKDLGSDDFVEMLLLDGVFLVQMIRLYLDDQEVPQYLYDMVRCNSTGLNVALRQDMLLVENQLPYFVLWELFCMIEGRAEADKDKFIKAIYRMFQGAVPGKERPEDDLQECLETDFKHLLDFAYHCCWHPSTSEMEEKPRDDPNCLRLYITHLPQSYCCHPSTSEMRANPKDDQNSMGLKVKHLHHSWYNCSCSASTSDPENNELKFIRCATELQEAGIKFKLFKKGKSMFDIKFEKGTLLIPKIEIGDYTERFLRNLINYEQMSPANEDFMPATDYMTFMDYLIDSPKDVEILCQEGIIVNMLGDDRTVAKMINDLSALVIYPDKFYYTKVFKKVNNHCSGSCHRWMANLKHNYFNSPWAGISVLAAALLLLLTVLQTVFSFLST